MCEGGREGSERTIYLEFVMFQTPHCEVHTQQSSPQYVAYFRIFINLHRDKIQVTLVQFYHNRQCPLCHR